MPVDTGEVVKKQFLPEIIAQSQLKSAARKDIHPLFKETLEISLCNVNPLFWGHTSYTLVRLDSYLQ